MDDTFFLILFGGTIIFGVVGTIAYYFARYGFRSPEEVPRPTEEVTPRSPEMDASPEAGPEAAPKLVSLAQALKTTKQSLWGRLTQALGGQEAKIVREEIEEILFTSDLGVAAVERLMHAIDQKISRSGWKDQEEVKQVLRAEMGQIFGDVPTSLPNLPSEAGQSKVWLVVGVNGVGKTTTIGKLANWAAQKGCKVLVAAGDTFRAAAGSQLKTWSERAQVEIFSPEGVTDPAAVAYQAVEKGRSEGYGLVIVDTAGRLHTQKNLMEELKKVKRVLAKIDPLAPHETLLVLDANSGQNALAQAREFHQALDLTGAILTKMDGTAKGGVALGLATELKLPLRWIGVGETIEDLRPFEAKEYVEAII